VKLFPLALGEGMQFDPVILRYDGAAADVI
jgi:hypothetical protein